MARIRTIKPDFWTDGKIIECSLSARLLFIGMWNFADDSGNLDRSAKQIKARVFPSETLDCEPLIHELITQGLLIEYSVSDQKYLHIPNFRKHQVINRPSKPHCPAYENSVSNHGGLTLEGKGREGKGKNKEEVAALPEWVPEDAWKAWLEVRPKVKAPNTPNALKLALKELTSLRDEGQDPRAVLEAATLKGWRGLFAVSKGQQSPKADL